jgi:hypothetical protein
LGIIGNEVANINPGFTDETLYFDIEDVITNNGFAPAICDMLGGQLQRNDGGDAIFLYCDNNLNIANTVACGCYQIQLVEEFS